MKDKDLKIIITKGSGPGGQHKNKVESCVTIIHLPTGLQQRCQETRSKIKNIELAKTRLQKQLDKLNTSKFHNIINQKRIDSINKGIIRTYNYSRNEVHDHRTKIKANLKRVLNGELDLII